MRKALVGRTSRYVSSSPAALVASDIRARWLGERLGPALGQLIVVENRSGAGGNLGTAAAAHSAPDGYTLVIVHIGTMAINPHLYASPGYDPLTDLVPITRLGAGPQVLVVHRGVPAASVAELLSLAGAKPDELSFVSPGIGTPGHLASSMLLYLTETKATTSRTRAAGRRSWTWSPYRVLEDRRRDSRHRHQDRVGASTRLGHSPLHTPVLRRRAVTDLSNWRKGGLYCRNCRRGRP
jgi:hypothetical protein